MTAPVRFARRRGASFHAPGASLWALGASLVLLACSGASPPEPAHGTQAGACAPSRGQRALAAELYQSGKLDRAHRTLQAANAACADEAATSWGLELQTLIELGLEGEASALAREMEAAPGVAAADAARARAWLAEPHAAPAASGEQLLAQGLAANAAGQHAAAQKLFDRARLALESSAGTAMQLEPPRPSWGASALSWSPDGRTLVLADAGELRSFETDGYREVSRLSTGSSAIASLAFSPDARTLALGEADGGVSLWDVTDGRALGQLASDVRSALKTLVFSPDGTRLVGRSWEDARVVAWDVASRQPLPSYPPARGEAAACGVRGGTSAARFWPSMLAFSPDGSRLLGTCEQNLVSWSPAGAGSAQALTGAGSSELYSVAVHPGGRYAVAGSESGALAVWDIGAGRRLSSVEAHAFNPVSRFSRDGTRLVSAAVDGSVRTFSFAAGVARPSASQQAPFESVSALAIDPDAARVAFAGAGALIVQNAVTGEVTPVLRAPLALTALAVDPRLTRLALGTSTGAVGTLDVAGGSIRWSQGHGDAVNALAFSADGAVLASASRDKQARVWDVNVGQARLVLAHPAGVNGVAFGPDGHTLATAGEDGRVRVWDLATGKEARSLDGSSCSLAALAYSPDGSLLVASAADQGLLRWDTQAYARAESPAPSQPASARGCGGELRASASSLAFSSDGALLAATEPASHGVELWSARSGEARGRLGEQGQGFHSTSVALSPREPLAVAGGSAGAVAWRLPAQTRVELAVPPGGVDALLFSADGRFLFGASPRGRVFIWSVAPGGAPLQLALTLELPSEHGALARSADGLVQWLGPVPAGSACALGPRLYPVELCEERFTAPGLVSQLLAGK